MRRKWIHIVAGPNGAGKTTLARELLGDVPVINPDRIAARLSPASPGRAAFAAGRSAIEELRERLDAGESFGTETTLSGRWTFRFMEEAREKGYGLELVYIGVEGERLAIQRVKERAEGGGHDVPERDVRRRYRKSLEHLPVALARVDHAMLYDNSAPAPQGPRIFCEIEDSVVVALEPDRPQWFEHALGPGARLGDELRWGA